MEDLRERIFRSLADRRFVGAIVAEAPGIVAGVADAREHAEALSLIVEDALPDGVAVDGGTQIMLVRGTAKLMASAEETLVGCLAKPSGIATATRRAVEAAGSKPRIVCGAWKKMPGSIKDVVRNAALTGGAARGMCDGPFLYLDKNYLTMFGGIRETLAALEGFDGWSRVVQIKGRYGEIVAEAREAAACGAKVLFVDTGRPDDLAMVDEEMRRLGQRESVQIAFGGGIRLDTIGQLKTLGADILCIGQQIVDAPLLDMRFEVLS